MSTRTPLAAAVLALTALLAGAPAHARDEVTNSVTNSAANNEQQIQQEKLYIDGLQAISEGRKNDASELFRRLIEKEPQHAGAYLEIALIQCELGHAEYAESLFKDIEVRFQPSKAIMDLINSARAKGCAVWQPHVQWSMTAGRGYDQNVNQGASNPNFSFGHGDTLVNVQLLPEYLPLPDRYTTASAEYQRDLSQNGLSGFVQFQGRRNDSLNKYDTLSLFTGIDQPWHIGNWPVRATAMAGGLSLGGTLYQKQTALQARVTPPLKLPQGLQFNLTAGLTHAHYQTLDGFDSNTADLRGQLSHQTEHSQTLASFGYARDHALGARPGGDRKGWVAGLQSRAQISARLIGEIGITRQTWLSENVYSPGLIDEKRDQATTMTRAALIMPIATDQSIHLELRDVRNKENISIFQYNSRQLQLTWQWQH